MPNTCNSLSYLNKVDKINTHMASHNHNEYCFITCKQIQNCFRIKLFTNVYK